ncbi:MAG: DsbA family oxidoreductase [Xanthomonadales bacterium]|nr:DsbA family oxidoreductase [Xanthomonadales bacterium]
MTTATNRLHIDFVSDVVCPWCAIGLHSLEQAIAKLGDDVEVAIAFQPFELNPDLGADGEAIDEHLARKYGASAVQLEATREAIRQRGDALGFRFGPRERIWNTFDAHRLLHWAALEGAGQARALKHALLAAYFSDGADVSDRDVLVRAAEAAGLDGTRARAVLASGEYADAVREREASWAAKGIHSVPAVIINDRYLISGGQPVEVFEGALRSVLAGREE